MTCINGAKLFYLSISSLSGLLIIFMIITRMTIYCTTATATFTVIEAFATLLPSHILLG